MEYLFYQREEVLEKLKTSEYGLKEETAKDRLSENGPNELKEENEPSIFSRFIKQLTDPMIIVLIFSAIVSAGIAIYANESFTDTLIIAFVVIVNAILGVYQESKAAKAIKALNNMSSACSKVLRDDKITSVKTKDLVPGDIIILEAGDTIPADVRIIESYNLKVEESALTGESVPVEKISDALKVKDPSKNVPLSEQTNMAFMGSNVVYGRGKAVVIKTGMGTQMGKIANYIETAKDNKTPLQIKLNQLSRILSFLVIAICVFMFLFKIFVSKDFSIHNIVNTFMLAISLAVAAIPEGLATVVTIQLALGVSKMAKHNAIIRKLTAVETLGCTQVICSDKTGTLTQNVMTVTKTYTENEKFLSIAIALCNDADIQNTKKSFGDPTEIALLKYAEKFCDISNLKNNYRRIFEIPFSSERKTMTTIHSSPQDEFIQFTKGAIDVVLNKCSKYLKKDKIIDLTPEIKEKILAQNKKMTSSALRVLAVAIKHYDNFSVNNINENNAKSLEKDLIFVGLCGMIDPLREESIKAVNQCKEAGIRPIMITGDHKDTATAIAKELGIIKSEKEVLEGNEIDELSSKAFLDKLKICSVFARVQPEHKVKIVSAFQRLKKIVAMTGDGVNDAPAIKMADIGIGMGKTGTDVTKNVADMVLADDNFATIVTAVKEGRKIYSNIQKSILFLISSNISEVLTILIATLFNLTIFSPIHILWINLITDTFPALSLGLEKEEKNLMKNKPRPKSESLFTKNIRFDIYYQGVIIAFLSLLAYLIGNYINTKSFSLHPNANASTMAFLTLSLTEIFHSINLRSISQSIFKIPHRNSYLIWTTIVSIILTLAVIYFPALSNAFQNTPLSFFEFSICMVASLLIIPTVELVKWVRRNLSSEGYR